MAKGDDATNGDIRDDLRHMKRDIKDQSSTIHEVKGSCNSIITILHGDEESDSPGGLIHKVFRNTQFRNRSTKILWFTMLLVLSLVIEKAFEIFR